MDPATTHPSLLLRLRDTQDRQAWREFDRRYGELVIGYCRSRGLRLADAEDIRQIVMLNLARGLPGFDYQPARGRFRDYFLRVVRHAISRHFDRHAGRETVLSNDVLDATAPVQDAPAPQWEEQWVRHHCRLALRELRASFEPRAIDIFHRLLEGVSAPQIAGELAMTPEAVRKTRQRVKDRLREIVRRQISAEDGHD